jgi:methionyl-tRNA synthetase
MVFGLDSEFSEEALVGRINADLANDLGNLVSRSLTMIQRYTEGEIPAGGESLEVDDALKAGALDLIDDYMRFMKHMEFHKALMGVWGVIGQLNKYIDSMQPWVLAKSDRPRLDTVLFHIAEVLRIISALVWPIMPGTAEKIQNALGLAKSGRALKLDDIRRWGGEDTGRTISDVPRLFPRIEAEKKPEPAKEKKPGGEKAVISFKEFQKLDLRVGTITKAESIPKSKKLIKLTVDVGEERTVVAGIAGHYEPGDLEGRQVVLVVNLEPAKLMGVESQGMVLAAEDDSGVHLLAPDAATSPGSNVK